MREIGEIGAEGTDPDDEAGDEGDVVLWGADDEVGAGSDEGGEEGVEEDVVCVEGEEVVHVRDLYQISFNRWTLCETGRWPPPSSSRSTTRPQSSPTPRSQTPLAHQISRRAGTLIS